MTTAIPLNTASGCDQATTSTDLPVDWRQLTGNIRAGDHDAFSIYYQHFFDLVFCEVRRLSGRDEATCLDIVQETFVKVVRGIKPLPDRDRVEAWTRVVARTTTYDWLRKHGRQQSHWRNYAAEQDGPAEQTDHEIENAARLRWVESQLQQLPSDLRRMVAMRYRLGWSLARIGQHVGLKTGAVDGRLRRAMEKLKQQAETEFDE